MRGDLPHPEPRLEEGDGPAPSRFQICGAAMRSHAYVDSIVPLLTQESIVEVSAASSPRCQDPLDPMDNKERPAP